jgi:RimJ/RimL family protein N-acetyltransferase
MKNKIAFQTSRLTAHFIDELNQHNVIELYSCPENIEMVHGINAEADIRLSIECYEIYKNIGAYLIFENNSGKFVGIGGIQKQEPMNDGSFAMQDCDIEFLIVTHKEFGGRGYASEFCGAFFEKLFELFPNLTVPARVNKNNASCIKLLSKFGFSQEQEIDYHTYGNKFSLLKANSDSWKKSQQL